MRWMRNTGRSPYAPRIEITPSKALADRRVRVRVLNLEPAQTVTVRARVSDDLDRRWSAYAVFEADAEGCVDLEAQAPLSGTYEGVDPMGLFWSMGLDPAEEPMSPFTKTSLKPIFVTFTAEVEWQFVASATFEKGYVVPGVTSQAVRDQRLVGTFFKPPGAGPHPALLVLSGADGGMYQGVAARFASYGYAALALAYFGVEHLPKQLANVPLEYFEAALGWLQAQPGVAPGKVGVVGWSRGGELALLLGATFPQVKTVIGYSASGVMTMGNIRNLSDLGNMQPSWSHHGKPLPYMPSKIPPYFEEKARGDRPVALATLYAGGLEDLRAVEKAAIPVEKINGPVLLVTGRDDRVWPSALLSDIAMERLARHNHPHSYEHLSYEAAGNTIGLPYRPTTITRYRHPIGAMLDFGGTPAGNAHAEADSWPKVLRFLGEGLKG